MSAAEKLRALEPIYITIAELGEVEYALYDLPLPQIVAVVEAAEAVADPTGTLKDAVRVADVLANALTALEEALS